MSRASKVLVMVVVVALGVWGCARKPNSQAAQVERVRALEERCAQLEQDYRTVAAARDQARKQAQAGAEEGARLGKEMAAVVAVKDGLTKERDGLRRQVKAREGERDGLRRQLALTTGERDDLRTQVNARTNERDQLQGRCDRMRKGLQTLLAQDESPFPPQAPPVTSATTVGGQS
jgi:chromosome segregation ATPase